MSAPLTLNDILDARAYERARDQFRAAVITRKKKRRISVGPIVTLMFECVDTVRFQVQEMARVERILSDEGIQTELDIYNKLLPTPGELSATLFVELTSDAELREWLPALVGIESAVSFEIGGSGAPLSIRSVPEEEHAEALTREEITAAVHYVRFPFNLEEIRRFGAGPVSLAIRHPRYNYATDLSEETIAELLSDLEDRTLPTPLS
jgi:Protein of unknown function (DUF3501)